MTTQRGVLTAEFREEHGAWGPQRRPKWTSCERAAGRTQGDRKRAPSECDSGPARAGRS